VKKGLVFLLGILLGIYISYIGYKFIHGNKYAILNQDYQLSNGGVLKKGTKIKYNSTFSEGFEQYTLYLNMSSSINNDFTFEKESFTVIPYWVEPFSEDTNKE
jgi:hypothetical protein